MYLTDALETIKGIGETTKDLLHKAGLFTVNDFLHFYPRDYISFPELSALGNLPVNHQVVVKGTVIHKPTAIFSKGKKFFHFSIGDGTGELRVYIFNQNYRMPHFPLGKEVILYGKVSTGKHGTILSNPKSLSIDQYEQQRGKLRPIYSSIAKITTDKIYKLRDACLEACACIPEYLPTDVQEKYMLMPLKDAFLELHAPSSEERLQQASSRLAFDEFLLFLLKMSLLQAENGQKRIPTKQVFKSFSLSEKVIQGLPYQLTGGQKETLKDIWNDLQSGYLMNRLIQGDVGCGKTIVALLAAFAAVENGYQAAIMAPTEVLATQHYLDLCRMNDELDLNMNPCLLSGSVKAAEKRSIKEKIADGTCKIIIGTHALLEDNVVFSSLGLIVTDEQHRFGVKQREKLMNKGSGVHTIVMSATPIPRTLGLILYGDLSVSNIKELPGGRLPIKNAVMDESYRPTIYRFMEKQIKEGRQCYVICPMVEEDESGALESVTEYAEKLKEVLSFARIGIMHGRLKGKEKDTLMQSFKNHELDILVSTTVIEVGVNVPNATCMLIENAERFGLAQLHQLRGRVGRGDKQSYCMFVSGNTSKKTMERLSIMEKTVDGFKVAEEDLKQRGPGDFFGIRQSGGMDFKIADLYRDAQVLTYAKEYADHLVQEGNKGTNLLISAISGNMEISENDFHMICL